MNNSYETEIVIVSFYTQVIQNILKEHKKLSTFKIMVFAFLLKKQKLTPKIYTGSNKNDVLLKFLSQLSGEYNNLIKDLKYLFQAIDILIKSKKVIYQENMLKSSGSFENKMKSTFTNTAINESKLYSDEQFMKEVLYYV